MINCLQVHVILGMKHFQVSSICHYESLDKGYFGIMRTGTFLELTIIFQ